MIGFPRVEEYGSSKTHVGKIQGSDSLMLGTATDPNPLANRGRGRPVACQEIIWVIGDMGFESKQS